MKLITSSQEETRSLGIASTYPPTLLQDPFVGYSLIAELGRTVTKRFRRPRDLSRSGFSHLSLNAGTVRHATRPPETLGYRPPQLCNEAVTDERILQQSWWVR